MPTIYDDFSIPGMTDTDWPGQSTEPVSWDWVFSGTAASERLRSNVGHDHLYGNGGNDWLNGFDGNDYLSGGRGYDRLYGGKGRDAFVFDVKPSRFNMDKVADFKVRDDSIYLENSIYKAVGKAGSIDNPKVLKSSYFYSGAAAHDADDHVIYSKETGVLYYDADGTGEAAQVKIATLSKNLKMTYKDLFVI